MYYYTIQLSMVIESLQNLKRRIELLIPKFPLTVINCKIFKKLRGKLWLIEKDVHNCL